MDKINYNLWFKCRNTIARKNNYADWIHFLQTYKDENYFNWSIVAEMETESMVLYHQKNKTKFQKIIEMIKRWMKSLI